MKTLFLDRDGVINKRIPDAYIGDWDLFEFYENAIEAILIFNQVFERVIIVTNQQGIGKGLISNEDVAKIHRNMMAAIEAKGGKIAKIYCCGALKSIPNNCRKPNPAMALQAQKDFPDIDFESSTMVGDSATDMEFGNNLGMRTIFITTKPEDFEKTMKMQITERHASLFNFAQTLI